MTLRELHNILQEDTVTAYLQKKDIIELYCTINMVPELMYTITEDKLQEINKEELYILIRVYHAIKHRQDKKAYYYRGK